MGRVTLALAAALALLAVAVPVAAAAPKAGPKVAKCGKLKKKAAKKRCQKQNQANRIAFNQIKNGTFTGYRGDGEHAEITFCANGRYRSVSEGSDGRGISTGRSWRVRDAVVGKGGRSIDAFIAGEGGFEVALQRRGKQWYVGVASLGRVLYPGPATRAAAAGLCVSPEFP